MHSAQETREGIAQLSHSYELSPSQVRSFDERRYLRIPALLPPAVLAEARARIDPNPNPNPNPDPDPDPNPDPNPNPNPNPNPQP